ncbi:MAG: sigma-54 dependent transcriptional regulator [candidate division KSB1 bacterium]|nr:sigma-54 dependent transcriptional regulator [candidate division KSB1 bacterium]MDZ7304443.1 sigma-54 dependent transcriptional regulator [candidate division KSB1 bacterium]MDZ7310936.1 sigma-54 dependent transcriptional regulator [candidate division KSB1 bacterium]
MSLGILVVDDEQSVRESLARVLEREHYQVFPASSGEEALRCLEKESVHVVLSDLKMPEMSGLELLRRVKTVAPATEVILITGHGTIEIAVEAMKQGAYDFITKPFRRAEIIKAVEKALEKRRLADENRELREQLASAVVPQTFIGRSEAVRKILEIIDRVAPLNSTVLITGESGTGKEIVARMLHAKSERVAKRFVAVNCGAISENLIESELFGHVKGSFTGAIRDKEGLFKTASGGTLFLDEISNVPINLQVKLLRALEQKEILPVGATRPVPIDTRIIAASNRDLAGEVEADRFREDLFYRLNVVGINIPPLRERRDDIPLLVDYFVNKFNRELKKIIKGVDADTMETFLNYQWKGNVRELENVIERAMILCDDDYIRLHHLPQNFASASITLPAGETLKEGVMAFERERILKALEAFAHDKKAAAKFLGLSLSSLYRKLSELGIEAREPVAQA